MIRLIFVGSQVPELKAFFFSNILNSSNNLKSCPEVLTFKLLDSTVGIISFINNDDDIPRLRLDDLDDEEKFRMKKKAAGALLKVKICLYVDRIKGLGSACPARDP